MIRPVLSFIHFMPNISTQELEQIGEGIRYAHNVYNAFLSRIHELQQEQKEIIQQAKKNRDAKALKQVRKKLQ